jgi:hypothetical protein
MNKRKLEEWVDLRGVKHVIAVLSDICISKASSANTEDVRGKAGEWLADSQVLRSILPRLRN